MVVWRMHVLFSFFSISIEVSTMINVYFTYIFRSDIMLECIYFWMAYEFSPFVFFSVTIEVSSL
jgi:hypothetical protein